MYTIRNKDYHTIELNQLVDVLGLLQVSSSDKGGLWKESVTSSRTRKPS